jgi:hypothetical protein
MLQGIPRLSNTFRMTCAFVLPPSQDRPLLPASQSDKAAAVVAFSINDRV